MKKKGARPSWRNVLEIKDGTEYPTALDAQVVALALQYPFFCWNGKVYKTGKKMRQYEDTGWLVIDLDA